MKTEDWFQLRNVGVTTIREPGFCRACLSPRAAEQRDFILACGAVAVVDTDHVGVRGRSGAEDTQSRVESRLNEGRFVPPKLAAIHNACTDLDRIKHRPAAAKP